MRSTLEWIGKTDDAQPPDRVRMRVFVHYKGRCQCGCDRLIYVGEPWELEHRIALINGGQNIESNLIPLLREHHKSKTKTDLARKAKIYAIQKRHYGVRKPRGQPMPGTKASGWKKKLSGEVVKRS